MTSTVVVESAEAATVLARGRGTGYLGPYFEGPASIAEAAQVLAKPLARVHYWTHRWHDLGILEVAEVTPRKGRPIRRYRTVADVFEVPPELVPPSLFQTHMARVNRQMVAAMEKAAPDVVHGGMLRIHKPEDQRGVTTDHTLVEHDRHPSEALQTSFVVELDREQAEQLCRELQQLRDRWLERSARSGRATHLVALALAPSPRR